MNKSIAIIGGDLRIVELAKLLVKDNFKIYTYALEECKELEKFENCTSIEEAIKLSDIIIGPIPLSKDKENVNTPFSKTNIKIEELIEKIGNKSFITGAINNQNYPNIIDILKKEELAIYNAISTAEGALEIAISKTNKTIYNSNILIMGFGRIGKILAKMLYGLNANVYCEARKQEDLAWIEAYGYNAIHLNDLNDNLGKFDIIINTIPVIILDRKNIDLINKQTLIIDLASSPGGIDRNYAKKVGINVEWALGLPGKVAPITSAEFIKKILYKILEEK